MPPNRHRKRSRTVPRSCRGSPFRLVRCAAGRSTASGCGPSGMTAGRGSRDRCPLSIHIVSIGRLCADTRGERRSSVPSSGSVKDVTIRSIAGEARCDEPSKRTAWTWDLARRCARNRWPQCQEGGPSGASIWASSSSPSSLTRASAIDSPVSICPPGGPRRPGIRFGPGVGDTTTAVRPCGRSR